MSSFLLFWYFCLSVCVVSGVAVNIILWPDESKYTHTQTYIHTRTNRIISFIFRQEKKNNRNLAFIIGGNIGWIVVFSCCFRILIANYLKEMKKKILLFVFIWFSVLFLQQFFTKNNKNEAKNRIEFWINFFVCLFVCHVKSNNRNTQKSISIVLLSISVPFIHRMIRSRSHTHHHHHHHIYTCSV